MVDYLSGSWSSAQSIELLIEANAQLVLLDGLLSRANHTNAMIRMFICREAVQSARLDGAQVTLEEIFAPSSDDAAGKGLTDVVNLIRAEEFAIDQMANVPLNRELIKETHAIMVGAGQNQLSTDAEVAIGELDFYMTHDEYLDHLNVLSRAALIHHFFEAKRPFLRDNGKVGRLLVTLFLVDKHALALPALHILSFLNRNREEYRWRIRGEYDQWLEFFLRAVRDSATDAVMTFDKLSDLRSRSIAKISAMGRSANTVLLVFRHLEEHPIIDIQKTASTLELSFNSVANAVDRLCNAEILVPESDKRRNRSFSYKAYLEILNGGL